MLFVSLCVRLLRGVGALTIGSHRSGSVVCRSIMEPPGAGVDEKRACGPWDPPLASSGGDLDDQFAQMNS